MAMRENEQAPDVMRRIFTIRNGSLIFLAFCVGVTFISVGITALLAITLGKTLQGQMGVLGQIFESVNTVFSGLGFIALVVTFRLQYDELRLQRQELESQRHAMDRTQSELRRSAEADIRTCHVELIRMSINDGDLAEVWPEYRSGLSEKSRKQYLYANLIVQQQRMMHDLGVFNKDDIRTVFRYFFTNQVMRDFWEATMVARQVVIRNGGPEWDFDQLIDQAYNDTFPAGSRSTLPSDDIDICAESESDAA